MSKAYPDYPIKKLCALLHVSASTYYYAQKPSTAAPERDMLIAKIQAIHDDVDATYGKRRMQAELASQGQALLFDFVAHLSTPVIAAINGFALGGGLELAMSAHFRIASENAKMGLPEVSLGVIPGYGGTQRLPQLVGKGRAFEMIMTAGMISAEQALQYGLVNHVTTLEDLMPLTEKIAGKIANNSSVAISAAITAINAGYEDGENGYDEEITQFGKCFGTADFHEGTQAFLEKRKANFPGK